MVSLSVTVTDRMNRYVTDLDLPEFSVFEDGVKQDVTFFNRRQQPIALSLLLDSSASMEEHLSTLQAAATNFVRRLRPNDLAQVIDFDSRVTVRQPFTSSQAALETAIQQTVAGGSTSLHNAIYVALKELGKIRAVADEDVRRQALVVFSDGEDTSSLVSFEEVLDLAKRSETAIYTIALRGADTQTRGFREAEFVLRSLAQDTGGRAFFPAKIEDLAGVYAQIGDELASQYTLGYTSKNPRRDGAWRRVIVQLSRPNMIARAKNGTTPRRRVDGCHSVGNAFPLAYHPGAGGHRSPAARSSARRPAAHLSLGSADRALYVTVTDGSNRLITDLPRDAFEVLDNGRPQEITIFDNEVRPITVVVMLDTSISMTLRLDDLFAGAEQFLLRLLPHDRAMLGAFNDKLQFTSGFTNDRDDLIASLKDLQYGNATRLYDALYASLDQLQGADGRKVMLLFTDGADFGSRQGPGRALERARDEEVMIYGVGLETEFFNGQRRVRSKPDEILNRFARETGGGYFELKLDADLNASFTRIAQELRSQYLIGFSPAVLDGKVHTLEVRVKRQAHKARSRRSYVASAELTQSENVP